MPIPHEERLRAGWLSVVASVAVFAGKGLAFVLTGSAAIFSDAAESIVNVVAAALLVWSLAIAARPADPDHPYGHGKVEFFTAGIEGVLILVAAAMIAVQAVRALVAGSIPQELGLGIALLAGASLVNGVLGAFLVRTGRRTGSIALEADGRHVLADVWTSAGVVGGLVLVRITGWSPLDGMVALAVAAWILREGVGLTRAAVQGLMDAADEALLDSISEALEADRADEWIDVHDLRAWRSGAALHTDLHLVVPRYFDVERLHAVHEEVERRILPLEQGEGDAVVHFDPCDARHCPGCVMPECPVRSAVSEGRAPLTRERSTRTHPERSRPPGPSNV